MQKFKSMNLQSKTKIRRHRYSNYKTTINFNKPLSCSRFLLYGKDFMQIFEITDSINSSMITLIIFRLFDDDAHVFFRTPCTLEHILK